MSVALIVPDNDTAAPERLSEIEFDYHRYVMAHAARLPQIDQQIASLQAQRTEITGARDSWMQFQADSRHLNDGDTINGEGYVIRQSPGGLMVPDQGAD